MAVILAGAMISAGAAADPLHDGHAMRWSVAEPEDHTGYTAEVRLNPDGSISIVWGTGKDAVTKTFEKVVADELMKTWGARTFDIRRFPNDLDCVETVVWDVEAKGGKRTLCKDGRALRRLADFASSIQLIMSSP